MFDKLFELIKAIWNDLVPYYIVTEMEMSCILRLGKFNRISGPGIHFKIPFVDDPRTYHVKTCMAHLCSQTLTTLDGKSIVVRVISMYFIFDIKKYTIEVWDAKDAINGVIQGIVENIVKTNTWIDVKKGIEEEILKRAEVELKEWGIGLDSISLSDLSETRSFRIIR